MDIDYFKETFHFSLGSDSPLYEQLASYIKIQIQAGILKPGDQMITEANLCKILNISRTTVRQCMDRLVEEGLLVRYRGRGSFIADSKMKRNINYLYNFTENMKELGANPNSIVLKSEVEMLPFLFVNSSDCQVHKQKYLSYIGFAVRIMSPFCLKSHISRIICVRVLNIMIFLLFHCTIH